MLSGVRRLVLVGAACAVLLGGALSPAYAGESDPQQSPVVGAFGLGDGLEGTISERDGAFEFGVSAGAVSFRWDSREPVDRNGLGAGWSWGFGHLETLGGIRVARASGGVHELDRTHVTGLAGYGVHDTRFEAESGVLEPRDGAGAPVRYEYVLHELGGSATYFDGFGDPVAQVSATGQRSDWGWAAAGGHRLLTMVDPDGVVLALDWETEPGSVLVRPGANLPPEPVADSAEPVDPVWRIELDGGRVSVVTDPTGGRVTVGYDRSGRVERVTGRSGASTVIGWQAFDDSTSRVESVRTVDSDGAELSSRRWAPAGDGSRSSGWPRYGGDAEVFWSGDAGFRYTTALSDGTTRVESEYNSVHELVSRRLFGTTGAGEVLLREQAFEYPGTEDGGVPDPHALPGNWSRPMRSEVTVRDASGGARGLSETFAFDELGRVIERTAVDGTRTLTSWDGEVPEGRLLPIGLQTEETVVAPDGLASRISHTLNGERTAVIATETAEGRDETSLVGTGRVEYDVDDDGFVSEQRTYPVRGAHASAEVDAPSRTRWTTQVDLAAGTLTSTETVGAGTDGEATTTSVSSLRHGGARSVTGPTGLEATVEFDVTGRPTLQRDPVGNLSRIRYETAQQDGRNATVVTTADGVERTEIRDPLGRVTRLTDNIRDGEAEPGYVRVAETRDYPEPGVASVTDAWGATTTAQQDVFGRVTRTVTPTGLVRVVQPDEVGNTVTSGLTPTGKLTDAEQITTERFDDAGQSVGSTGTRRDGRPTLTVEHTLDGFGRAVTTTDGVLTTATTFDEYGQPATTTLTPMPATGSQLSESATGLPVVPVEDGSRPARGNPITTEQRFDGFGTQVEKLIGDEQRSRSGGLRAYDTLGRLVSETDQAGRVSRIEYTLDGLVSVVEHGSGRRTELTYDVETRALVRAEQTAPDADPVIVEFRYDPVTGRLLEQSNPDDPDGTRIATRYDAFGNPTEVSYPDGATMLYEYDAHGRRTGLTDVLGNRTEYGFDTAGVITGVSQRDRDGNPVASAAYTYDEFGRIAALARGNGVTTAYTFTSAGQVATERSSTDVAVLSERDYDYDVRGNLIERTDTEYDRAGVATSSTTKYGYDAYDRLTRSSVHDGDEADAPVMSSTEYELSSSGDIVQEVTIDHDGAVAVGSPDPSVTIRDFEYSPRGELLATTTTAPSGLAARVEQRYDEAGNLLSAGDGTSYIYDAANRPIVQRHADGTARQIEYWIDGSRRSIAEHTASGEPTDTTTFHWSGASLLNETVTATGTADRTASYLVGAGRHSRSVGTGDRVVTSYLGTDRHGSVTDLTDQAGEVTMRYAYSDYGVRTSAPQDETAGPDTNPFGYSGEYTNPDGTQHLAVRTYDAVSMRFTTMDTAELHNTYAYADLNPITGIDPTGRAAQPDTMQILTLVGAVVGLALTAVSCVFAPPVGIMKGFTVAFVIGDLLAAANSSIHIAQPEGMSRAVSQSLEQGETIFGAIAAVGFVYGVGRFVASVMSRRAAAAAAAREAQEALEVQDLLRLPQVTVVQKPPTIVVHLPQVSPVPRKVMYDTVEEMTKLIAANGVEGFGLNPLSTFLMARLILLRSPVDHVTTVTNQTAKFFWAKFWVAMDVTVHRGSPMTVRRVHWDVVLRIAACSAAGDAVDEVRQVRELATQVAQMKIFANPAPRTWFEHAWNAARNLEVEVTLANTSYPLVSTVDIANRHKRALGSKPGWWKELIISDAPQS